MMMLTIEIVVDAGQQQIAMTAGLMGMVVVIVACVIKTMLVRRRVARVGIVFTVVIVLVVVVVGAVGVVVVKVVVVRRDWPEGRETLHELSEVDPLVVGVTIVEEHLNNSITKRVDG